jgi:hypothetical protein
MIEDSFDSRTRARMALALERVCEGAVNGETHAVRKRVARQIIKSAISGKATLDELVAAGQHAVARTADLPDDQARHETNMANRNHSWSQ